MNAAAVEKVVSSPTHGASRALLEQDDEIPLIAPDAERDRCCAHDENKSAIN